jgi:hypothetical protein
MENMKHDWQFQVSNGVCYRHCKQCGRVEKSEFEAGFKSAKWICYVQEHGEDNNTKFRCYL